MKQHSEVVVVTGASAGVGRAVAHAFAKRGATVGLLARGSDGLEACAAEVEAAGGRALVVSVDVADCGQVESAARRVEAEFGPIDVWVNDAMATVFAAFDDVSPDEFKRATEVTYLGTVNGTRAALKRMLPRDSGAIVQVGSALAYRAIPLQSAYCGAKFAVRGFTDSVRTELMHRKSRVRITMVQLPAVDTPQFSWCRSRLPDHPQPVPPIYEPEVPAELVYAAAHGRRREYWCGGSTVAVILGSKLAPAIADRYLAATGVRSQQVTGWPVPPDRPDNLFSVVPELASTRGPFSDRAKRRSWQGWLSAHRPSFPVALAAGGVAAALIASRRR
jgi:NAD(P)-dependent dehydrogenase (short-subunit alcohol dehydrogenase family)